MFDSDAKVRVLKVVWRLLLMRSMDALELWQATSSCASVLQRDFREFAASRNLKVGSSSTSHATAAGLLRRTCTLGRCDNMNALVGYGSSDEEEEAQPTRPSKVGDCYSRELGSVDAY